MRTVQGMARFFVLKLLLDVVQSLSDTRLTKGDNWFIVLGCGSRRQFLYIVLKMNGQLL